MACEIRPSDDGTYIWMRVWGDVDRTVAMAQNLEAHALGRKLGIHKYLVDMTEARNVQSAADKRDFAYRDMREGIGIDRSAKVAILIDENDHSHDYLVIMARNAGLDITLFRDRSEALKHLTGQVAVK